MVEPIRPITVLVVDDNPMMTRLVEDLLNHLASVEVIKAQSLQAALEMLDPNKMDAVLVDLELPGEATGDQAVRALVKVMESKKESIPIVAFSAENGPRGIKAQQAGAATFFQKTLTPMTEICKTLMQIASEHRSGRFTEAVENKMEECKSQTDKGPPYPGSIRPGKVIYMTLGSLLFIFVTMWAAHLEAKQLVQRVRVETVASIKYYSHHDLDLERKLSEMRTKPSLENVASFDLVKVDSDHRKEVIDTLQVIKKNCSRSTAFMADRLIAKWNGSN